MGRDFSTPPSPNGSPSNSLLAAHCPLSAKSFPCHTSEKSARKPNHCHTSKIAVCNPCVCHTSEAPRGEVSYEPTGSPSSSLHPIPLSPYPTFLLFPFFSHSCAPFCTHQNLNTFVFNRFRTLCKKPPGVGEGSLLETKPSLPHHTHTNQSEGEDSGKLDGWQSGCNYWRKPGHRPGHRPALRPGRRGRGLLLPLQQSGSRGSRGGHSEAGSQGCGIPMRRGPRCGRPKIHHRRRRAIRKDRHPREQRGTRTPRRFLGRHRRRLRRGPKRQFERSFLYHPGVREASHASKSRRQSHQHQLRA